MIDKHLGSRNTGSNGRRGSDFKYEISGLRTRRGWDKNNIREISVFLLLVQGFDGSADFPRVPVLRTRFSERVVSTFKGVRGFLSFYGDRNETYDSK